MQRLFWEEYLLFAKFHATPDVSWPNTFTNGIDQVVTNYIDCNLTALQSCHSFLPYTTTLIHHRRSTIAIVVVLVAVVVTQVCLLVAQIKHAARSDDTFADFWNWKDQGFALSRDLTSTSWEQPKWIAKDTLDKQSLAATTESMYRWIAKDTPNKQGGQLLNQLGYGGS
jgi:hypothetical protein